MLTYAETLGILLCMETPLSNKSDVTIDYFGEAIDLDKVGFTGTLCMEEAERDSGYPGFVEVSLTLDDVGSVVDNVRSWLDDMGITDEIDSGDIEDAVEAAISIKIIEDPGSFI